QPIGQLVWAFVFGSIAKSNEHAGSDIDLMLIGENLGYGDVVERLLPVEERLGRSIRSISLPACSLLLAIEPKTNAHTS
ncbi:MAG: nucleotidyltransferase domain-containing protein, partial [Gammaproteobacteria bacterium]|nr:nucleotidyltransferase domain-containing protein [Gammaproteobacteria bacterium]